MSDSLTVCLTVCLTSVWLSLCLCGWVSDCLTVIPTVFLSLSDCLFVCLSVCHAVQTLTYMNLFRCRMWPGFVIAIPTLNCHLKFTTRTTSQRKLTGEKFICVIFSKECSLICLVPSFQGRSCECYCGPWPWRWATWPGNCTILSSKAGGRLVASCWRHEKQWVRFLVSFILLVSMSSFITAFLFAIRFLVTKPCMLQQIDRS